MIEQRNLVNLIMYTNNFLKTDPEDIRAKKSTNAHCLRLT